MMDQKEFQQYVANVLGKMSKEELQAKIAEIMKLPASERQNGSLNWKIKQAAQSALKRAGGTTQRSPGASKPPAPRTANPQSPRVVAQRQAPLAGSLMSGGQRDLFRPAPGSVITVQGSRTGNSIPVQAGGRRMDVVNGRVVTQPTNLQTPTPQATSFNNTRVASGTQVPTGRSGIPGVPFKGAQALPPINIRQSTPTGSSRTQPPPVKTGQVNPETPTSRTGRFNVETPKGSTGAVNPQTPSARAGGFNTGSNFVSPSFTSSESTVSSSAKTKSASPKLTFAQEILDTDRLDGMSREELLRLHKQALDMVDSVPGDDKLKHVDAIVKIEERLGLHSKAGTAVGGAKATAASKPGMLRGMGQRIKNAPKAVKIGAGLLAAGAAGYGAYNMLTRKGETPKEETTGFTPVSGAGVGAGAGAGAGAIGKPVKEFASEGPMSRAMAVTNEKAGMKVDEAKAKSAAGYAFDLSTRIGKSGWDQPAIERRGEQVGRPGRERILELFRGSEVYKDLNAAERKRAIDIFRNDYDKQRFDEKQGKPRGRTVTPTQQYRASPERY